MTRLNRMAVGAVVLVVAAAASAQTPVQTSSDQPLLHAPWQGSAIITQGNHGSTSHNVAWQRSVDPSNTQWENTYALDIVQRDATGAAKNFDVLAPADGTVVTAKMDTAGMGGRQLHIRVPGANGKAFLLVLMHLSDIKPAYRTGGAVVHTGDVVANAGGSGNNSESTWSVHLHFHVFGTGNTPDSHTQGINRLRLRRTDLAGFQDYESKGDGIDDAMRPSLDDAVVGGRTFVSDNVPSTSPLVINGDFERILAPANAAADGSWTRTYYRGTDFAVLRGGGTWGRNGSAAYLYLGAERNSVQWVESRPFVVPAGSASVLVRYYASVLTEETAAYPYDVLRVALIDVATGGELMTIGRFTNERPTKPLGFDVPLSYAEQAVRVFGLGGKSVKLRFEASNDAAFATWFRIDDVTATPE